MADLSHRELVGGNIDWLVVFPADQDLVALVEGLLEAPLHCLLQHLLLGDDGHLGQAILPDSTGSSNAHLRELVEEGEAGEQVVEENFTAWWQLGLLDQVQDDIWTLSKAGITDVGVAATVRLEVDAAAIRSADCPGLKMKTNSLTF